MVKLICECGVNFKNLDEAKLMIRKSKEIGAFLCKFQLYSEEQIKDSKDYEFLKSIMLDYNSAKELYEFGKEIKQEVFFSVMYPEAIDICERIGVSYYKLRCCDKYNHELIDKINETEKPCFVSTDNLSDGQHYDNIAFHKLLYCVPKYPATFLDYYYDFIDLGYSRSGDFDGISDHLGCTCLMQYPMNIDYIEKHCKLDNNCLESKWSVTFEALEEVLKP